MPEYKVLVRSGHHKRRKCPISVRAQLSEFALKREEGLSLVKEDGGTLPAQLEVVGNEACISFIIDELEAESIGIYDLKEEEVKRKGFSFREEKGEVALLYEGDLVLRYKYSEGLSKPYIYPVMGPGGLSMTEDGPKDHIHHRSLWIAHGDVNGVDLWSEREGHGRIVHKAFKKKIAGPVYAELTARNVWSDSNDVPLLDEERRIRVWALGDGEWYIDLDVSFIASYRDVVFGDTKEAGIVSVRVAPSIRAEAGGRIENSFGGINEEETWGKRACWCDYSGPLGGEWVGIAIFDHQLNPRHPTYWHVRNYGLMTANIFGLSYFERGKGVTGALRLRRGQRMKFRYRIFVHKGNTGEADVRSKYIDYIYPPSINIKRR